MRAAVLVGTRPEIIKMSPVLRTARARGLELHLIHSGQHSDRVMDGVFFEQLALPAPDDRLERPAAGPIAPEIARRLAPRLSRANVQLLFVHGDTNTALAGALAAQRVGVRIAHVEAGLRSFDTRMAEERNRRTIDRIADLLFCPTPLQAEFLRREGVVDGVHTVGNTIADALRWSAPQLADVPAGPFAVLTLHRAENVDDPETLQSLLASVSAAARELDLVVRWPVHPRLRGRLPARIPGVEMQAPVDYHTFLGWLRASRLALTDSGGVQEEAAVLGTPCVTLRPSTERQETLSFGNHLASPRSLVSQATRALGARWTGHPYGDGHTARRILDVVLGLESETRQEAHLACPR